MMREEDQLGDKSASASDSAITVKVGERESGQKEGEENGALRRGRRGRSLMFIKPRAPRTPLLASSAWLRKN